jgi:hypothetical protein
MRSRARRWGTLAALFVAVVGLVGAVGALRAALPDSGARRIVISTYGTEAAANQAFGVLKLADERGELDLEARSLVVKAMDGKVKAFDKRAPGTQSAQAVAAVSGLMGVKAGVTVGVGASARSASDYLTSSVVAMPPALVAQLKNVLRPGEAAIISSVDARGSGRAAGIQGAGAARVLTHDMPGYVAIPPGKTEPLMPMPVPVIPPGTP